MMEKLYHNRFEIFLISQLSLLFGSLIVPYAFFETILMPVLFLINICAGILLISKRKKLMWFLIALFTVALFVFGTSLITRTHTDSYEHIRMLIYFLFYVVITVNIISQVWSAKLVNKNVIIGLMCGYISLGLISFFIFMSIELATPGSFKGLLMASGGFADKVDSLLYYSYITLLTIGYGEIIPVTPIAQKAAILTGLIGQFYIVVITAVVVEKYIMHSRK